MALRDDLLSFVKNSLLRGAEDVDPDESLIDKGIIDSIGLMNLMTYLEERTGLRIPDHMVTPDNFQSVTAMEEMVRSLRDR